MSGARPTSARTHALDRVAAAARRLPNFRGKVALAWRLTRALDARGRLPPGPWRVRVDAETELELPRLASMAVQVAVAGTWDAPVQQLLAPHVKAGSLVLDIGASLGLWTVPLARLAAARGGHVWAFEPLPENLGYLERNLRLNGLSDAVTVHPVALGRRPGEVTVVGLEDGGGNAAVEAGGAGGTTVPMQRLDDIRRERSVSLIKIDVEGFELEVLAGARQLLQEDRPVVFGEFDSNWLHRRGADLPGFLREMSELGYELLQVRVDHSRPWRARDTPILSPWVAGTPLSGELLAVPRP